MNEWLDNNVDRFINDLDHHKEGSIGSYNRMIEWLKSAYEAGKNDN